MKRTSSLKKSSEKRCESDQKEDRVCDRVLNHIGGAKSTEVLKLLTKTRDRIEGKTYRCK